MTANDSTHKLHLNILERITIVNPNGGLLPQKGGISTMRAVDEAIKTIAISPEEEKELQGMPFTDPRLLQSGEFVVSGFIHSELKEALRKLEEKGELQRQHLSLWNQIVEGKIQPPPALKVAAAE